MSTPEDEMSSPTILREPRVDLFGHKTVDTEVLDTFLADHQVENWSTDTEAAGKTLIEVAGRVCSMSFAKPRPGGSQSHIGHILESGHGSVLEHAAYNLITTGVSRSFTHELVRYRAGSGYAQLGQRYVDKSHCEFVEPDVIASDPELDRVWVETVATCQSAYRTLVDGLAKKHTHSGDRTLRRKTAREAAIKVLRLLPADSPNLFGDYTISPLAEGGETAKTPHRTV